MGRWSYHPMGSDSAYDYVDYFFRELTNMVRKEKKNNYGYYLDKSKTEIRKYIESLNIDDLIRLSNYNELKINKYVIPYIYVEYNVKLENNDIHSYLLECLDSHEELDDSYDFDSEKIAIYIRDFKENFDDYIYGKKKLKMDKGI